MFDSKIEVKIKVSYQYLGKYTDENSREITANVAQIQNQTIRQELDHQYKYRFLVLDDSNNVKPLFAKDQTITGGAGDLMITITGLPGSGFEQCDPT